MGGFNSRVRALGRRLNWVAAVGNGGTGTGAGTGADARGSGAVIIIATLFMVSQGVPAFVSEWERELQGERRRERQFRII